MGHARSQGHGTGGSLLRTLAAELPSADQALDELIARANQAELAVGDDEVVEETIVEPAVVRGDGRAQALQDEIVQLQHKLDAADARGRAQAAAARRSPPWRAIAAGFVGGLVVMLAATRLLREPDAPAVAAPSATVTPTVTPIETHAASAGDAASATAAAPAAEPAPAVEPVPADVTASTPAPPGAPITATRAPSKPRPRGAPAATDGPVTKPAGALADPFGDAHQTAPPVEPPAKPAEPAAKPAEPAAKKPPAPLVNPF